MPRARAPAAAPGPRPRRDSVSRELFATALKLAANRELIVATRPAGRPGSRSSRRRVRCSSGSRRSTPHDWRRCSMATLDELLDAIAAGARAGRRTARSSTSTARVIDGYSAWRCYRHRIGARDAGRRAGAARCSSARGIDTARTSSVPEDGVGAFRGRSEEKVAGIGERLFKHEIAGRMLPGGVAAGAAHRKRATPGRARDVGDAFPGRAAGARVRRRPRALHARRERRRRAPAGGRPVLWGRARPAR